MAWYNVRIMTGNDAGPSQQVKVQANNSNDARRAAEGQTGGHAKGQSQINEPKK